MNRYIVAVLVRNQFGVLNRVTSMFRRRQFNITALTVSETESVEYSRITVTFDGEEKNKHKSPRERISLILTYRSVPVRSAGFVLCSGQ